jgi:S1-C subfamily serine protease
MAHASGLDTVDLGTSSGLAVDDGIVAIGNSQGRGGAPEVVPGTVTATGKTITAGDGSGTETLTGMIEVVAAIQSGDSGGPVVDANAEVVGMTTAASTARGLGFGRGPGAATTGYAIPIDRAESIVEQIRRGDATGDVHLGARGYLGVRATDDPSGAGAQVVGVQPGSAADGAGIAAGDVVVAVGGTRVGSADDLGAVLGAHAAGDRIRVVWVDRAGATRRSTVTLTDLT